MQDDPIVDPPKRRVAAVLVPLSMLLVGTGAGFAGATFLGAPAEASVPVAEHAQGVPADGTAPEGTALVQAEGPAIANLGTFTVNLRGSGGGRVLRLEVQVEAPPGQSAALANRSAQIRDTIITAVSDYTWSELEGTDGKTRLRDELLLRVNGVSAPVAVERLYFTQFIVQ